MILILLLETKIFTFNPQNYQKVMEFFSFSIIKCKYRDIYAKYLNIPNSILEIQSNQVVNKIGYNSIYNFKY